MKTLINKIKLIFLIFLLTQFSFAVADTTISSVNPANFEKVISQSVPENSFLWIGHPKRKFTNQELEYIANNYPIVVIDKFHANWDIKEQETDAWALHKLNPDIKLFPYLSMSYRFKQDKFGTDTFNQNWLLKDASTNQILPYFRENTLRGWVVDLSSSGYRDWLLNVIKKWLNSAPYSGIAFDNVVPISTNPSNRARPVENARISDEKISRWNDGLRTIMADTHSLNNHPLVIFNGIENTRTRDNRSLDLFKDADIALNENFCVAYRPGHGHGILDKKELMDDIDIMGETAANGKKILEHTIYKSDNLLNKIRIDKKQLSRFCYGVFMMGYQPGYDYFKFSRSYSAIYEENIFENADEIKLSMGPPVEKYKKIKGIWKREYEYGVIYLNPDNKKTHTIEIPEKLVKYSGEISTNYKNGRQEITIPPHEAAFFIKEDKLH